MTEEFSPIEPLSPEVLPTLPDALHSILDMCLLLMWMLNLSLLLHKRFLDVGVIDFPLPFVYWFQINIQDNQEDDSGKKIRKRKK